MRAIPSTCPASAPLGEQRVLEQLQSEQDTDGWVVLHSLALQKHARKKTAEADFVLLIPGAGVLTIEVKGCPVAVESGVWTYKYPDGPKSSIEGPFRQAAGASDALSAYLASRDATSRTFLYSYLVIFLIEDFDLQSPEWWRWQYLNRSDWNRGAVVPQLRRVMEAAHSHIRHVPNARWYDPDLSRPTAKQVSRLLDLLRPEFETPVQLGTRADDVLREQERFTDEQFGALDALDNNERILFAGAAGTGKTFIALESFRRETLAGRRVLLLCFNALLADWMRHWLTKLPGFEKHVGWVGTFHKLLIKISGATPNDASPEWWREELPHICVERLLQAAGNDTYDVLIVDEAQDLLCDSYADVMDLVLKKGLTRGRWRIFGDFEKQAIYELNSERANTRTCIQSRFARSAEFRLSINCRNAIKIGGAVTAVCGLKPGYSRFLNGHEGTAVPRFWTNESDQAALLGRELDTLSKTFRPDQIVVLSTRKEGESVASNLRDGGDKRLTPLRTNAPGGRIRFGTIHAFKGLEAPAVVLTDLTDLSSDQSQRLLYVGMTRARVSLNMLLQDICRKQYTELIRRALKL